MAKIGYLFLSRSLSTRDEDLAWMKEFGCERIIEEEAIQEKMRPQWRKMIAGIGKGDTIVVSKLSNAVRGLRELGAFLDLIFVHLGLRSRACVIGFFRYHFFFIAVIIIIVICFCRI